MTETEPADIRQTDTIFTRGEAFVIKRELEGFGNVALWCLTQCVTSCQG